jgi:hypothetical protein
MPRFQCRKKAWAEADFGHSFARDCDSRVSTYSGSCNDENDGEASKEEQKTRGGEKARAQDLSDVGA